MNTKLKNITIPDAELYRELVDQLAMFTDASNQFAALDAQIQQECAAVVDSVRDEYAILQNSISEHEASIKAIATAHPEWFEGIKTLKTPYGTVGFRAATKLEVPNEEMTIALLERCQDSDVYLRTRTFLNIEALELLTDSELAALKIQRVTADKCTVSPAKLDLGKAVKKAAENMEVAV